MHYLGSEDGFMIEIPIVSFILFLAAASTLGWTLAMLYTIALDLHDHA